MRALLLAAGYGTRLKPFTDNKPKCLMSVKGKPLLEIWLERLTSAGISPFLINTHYLSDQIEGFKEKSIHKKEIILVHEPVLLGTAGTLNANKDFFMGQDGILIHADNYCLANLSSFISAHKQRPRNCLITMMTFRTKTPSNCGIVEVNDQGVVTKFYEKVKNPPGNLANGAVYILSAEFISLLDTNFKEAKDFSGEIIGKLLGRIFSYETSEIFIDIGTPETYLEANICEP